MAESAKTRGASAASPQRLKCSYPKLANGAKAPLLQNVGTAAVAGEGRRDPKKGNFKKLEASWKDWSMGWHFGGAKPNPHLLLFLGV